MQLVVHELTASNVIQEIEIGDKALQIEAFRPHLFKWLNPSGSLQIIVKDETGTTTLFQSEAVTVQSITDASGDYYHGPIKFPILAALQANTKYQIVLAGISGYTFSESSYISWCTGYDLKVVPNSYSPSSSFDEGLILQAWERKKVQKGIY
jgi:hypothetical protein